MPARQIEVEIPAAKVSLPGTATIPDNASGIVAFAHGSGSSRHSPRNRYVADVLHEHNIATLLFDLLTLREDQTYETRFDIGLLTARLLAAIAWLEENKETQGMRIGCFGASTGAAAALQAAAKHPGIASVVSRGGRPDLAGPQALTLVRAPTLLIVGGQDDGVIDLNRQAYDLLRCEKKLEIVPGATHLFEEPGTLELAAGHAARWFETHL
jgi:dienelactone hydrolase